MTFPDHIFKAYDIRGVYPTELNEELVYKIARAFALLIKAEVKKDIIKIVVGEDMRLSSPALKKMAIAGLMDEGVDVIDIGLASTPTFYFGVSFYGYDAGLQISASHNPAKYNGLKMVRAAAVPVSGETGIVQLKEMVKANVFGPVLKKGSVIKQAGVVQAQIKYALGQVPVSSIKPFKIVIDTANGMGAPLMEELFKYVPGEIIKLFFTLDGSFPNHEADPFKDENNRSLQAKVVAERADLGIALDGDADRLFFVDNTGQTVNPAIVRGILAKIFLADNPGAIVCYDIRPGKITADMILAAGGVPVITRVGHSLIKEKARAVGAVFAGESSGHFFLKMPHGLFEVPEIMILKFLAELTASDQTLSEYIKPLEKYFFSGEINFTVADKEAVLARLKTTYHDAAITDLDGLSFTYPDFWFNVRASNTEPLLRLNLEAVSPEIMVEKTSEVSALITKN